jgi:Indoleamine 2,3-dioxygenase
LSEPLQEVCKKLEAKPWLDYYRSTVMYNYKRINPKGPIKYSCNDEENNLQIIRSFTGSKDEAGFFLTHVSINRFSPNLVESIENIIGSVKEKNRDKLNVKF